MSAIKRLHYYDHQYLREPDFTNEQNYHIDMRRRHNRSLHISGIVNGLELSILNTAEIKLSDGMAIDSNGRELIYDSSQSHTVIIDGTAKEFGPNQPISVADIEGMRYISIKYKEVQTDPPDPEFKIDETDRTRWTESVTIEINETKPTDTGAIILGRIVIDAGSITRLDSSDRRYSGVCGEGHFSKVGIGTNNPQATLDVKGTFQASVDGTGLMFDGSDDYVECGEAGSIGITNEMTIEAWIKVSSSFPANKRVGIIIGKYGHSPNFNFEGYINGQLRFYWNGGHPNVFATNFDMRDDTWHHVAVTRDSATDKIIFYTDGQINGIFSAGNDVDIQWPLRIGNDFRPEQDLLFNGSISEVRLWNVARTMDEIRRDMNLHLSGHEIGLVSYWPFDEGTGDKVNDLTLNANHGKIVGAQWFNEEIPAIAINKMGNVGIGTVNPRASFHINGSLFVSGNQNIIKVKTFTLAVQNAGQDQPGSWAIEYSGFSKVYTVFIVLQGFSLVVQDITFKNYYHGKSTSAIPQHVFVNVISFNETSAHGEAYCSESNAPAEKDNHILFTVVVIGRE